MIDISICLDNMVTGRRMKEMVQEYKLNNSVYEDEVLGRGEKEGLRD